ncbi:DUF4097 family beta strand repeat-containing protein [Streptomyces sp. NPDC057702]|uniref:DUF4097 family beta strand repeat-containing protein n=1 Tax=unclassified Streptomyces TaxID=2593676 RepID=UPI0036BDB86A
MRAGVAVGTVVLAVGALGGCASGEEKHERKSFAYGGRHLVVDSADAALRLTPYDGDTVEVDRYLKGRATDGPRGRWKLSGDRLELGVTCSGITVRCGGRFEVRVPRGVRADVAAHDGSVRATGFAHDMRITSSDGSVTVGGHRGSLDVRTGDGALRVEGVTGASVRLASGDGGVSATGLRVRVSELSAGDGSVRAVFERAPESVRGVVRDGSLVVEVPDDGERYAVRGRTGDGSRTVKVDQSRDARRVITASSGDGSVTVRNA